MQNLVYITDLSHSVWDQLVLLVELLNVLQTISNAVLVNLLKLDLWTQTLLERTLDYRMPCFDLFLHVFREGVPKGSELDVYFDDVLVGERKYFRLKKFLGSHLSVEQTVEVRVDDDFLLPVLHRLLLFINAHLILINSTQPIHSL